MALPRNEIGPHRFFHMTGHARVIGDDVELITRPGIDGVQAILTGQRGKPFTLTTYTDAADVAAAHELFLDYSGQRGLTLLPLVIRDIDHSAAPESTRVLVLDVRKVQCRRVPAIVGGLNPDSQALLICEWQLILIKQP